MSSCLRICFPYRPLHISQIVRTSTKNFTGSLQVLIIEFYSVGRLWEGWMSTEIPLLYRKKGMGYSTYDLDLILLSCFPPIPTSPFFSHLSVLQGLWSIEEWIKLKQNHIYRFSTTVSTHTWSRPHPAQHPKLACLNCIWFCHKYRPSAHLNACQSGWES